MKKPALRACAALRLVLSGMLGKLPVPPLPSCRSRLPPPLPNSALEGCWPRRYQVTRPLPKPPRRKDVSVPGIMKDRGKLPAPIGEPGAPGAAGRTARLHLRQLIDAALEEFLIGAQIRDLVGLGRRQARQQRDRGGHPPSAATVAIVRFLIIAPPGIKRCDCPREEHAFLSAHDIARGAAIKLALAAPWCFRRSVAGLQHIRVCAVTRTAAVPAACGPEARGPNRAAIS